MASPVVVLLAAMMAAGVGCSRRSEPAPKEAGLRVVVTIPPLEGLVKPLLSEGGEVRCLLAPGRSEHGFEFTPADLALLARADLVVYVGMGLEPQVNTYLSTHPQPRRRVVCMETYMGSDEGSAAADEHGHEAAGGHEHGDEHDHGEDDGHHHAGPDPHLWLDPLLVARFTQDLAAAVQSAYRQQAAPPALSAEAVARLDSAARQQFDRAIALHVYAQERLGPLAGRPIVTHHDAWRRLAERYGLKVAAVIRPIESAEPSPGDIAAAVRAIREQNVPVIFVEPQFNASAAERIARTTGVRIATLDPLGDGDYFAMMRRNIDAIADGLSGAPR
jgi:zinc transport system substrate-binding protein